MKKTLELFWLKLASVLLAIVVWGLFQEELITSRVIRHVPLDISLPKGLVIVDKEVLSVDIRLSGPKELLENLNKSAIRANYTFSETTQPGPISFILDRKLFKLPKKIKLKNVYPSQVLLVLDEEVEKDLHVKASFTETAMEGYRVAQVSVNPNVVRVRGAKKILSKLQNVKALPINISSQKNDFVQKVPLMKIPSVDQAQSVEVFVKIEKKLSKSQYKDFSVSVLKDSSVQYNVVLTPSRVDLTLIGVEKVLKSLVRDNIQIYVDITGLSPGVYELPLIVHTPEDINVAQYRPKVLQVEITNLESLGI